MRCWLLTIASLPFAACGGNVRETSSTSNQEVKVRLLSETAAGMDHLYSAYLSIKNTLVESDAVAADTDALNMLQVVDSLSNDRMFQSADSTMPIASLEPLIQSFLKAKTLSEKRRSFQSIGMSLQRLLSHPGSASRPVYIQTCPMAFDDTEAASWLSDSREIVNPYLGKNHPKYASGMLHCGELTDSLGFR